jgi:hypothetical protein
MSLPCCLCVLTNNPKYWSQKRRPLLATARQTRSRGNEHKRNNRRIVGSGVLYAVRVLNLPFKG